jgi:hypothetical protein
MNSQVLGLESGTYTAAYYALDMGLERIKQVRKRFMQRDPSSKYYIVFLTDGLDNRSVDLARETGRGRYSGRDAYAAALQKKKQLVLGRRNVSNTFESHVLFFKGSDTEESNYTDEELKERLAVFTGVQNTVTPEILVDSTLGGLLEEFKAKFVISSFYFEVPKDYAGSRIRMLLRPAEAGEEEIFFEADVIRKGRKRYRLANVTTSENFSVHIPENGLIPMYEKQEKGGPSVRFLVENIQYNGGAYKVNRDLVSQWEYWDGKLRKNSEYDKTARNDPNAYLLVILDTSRSFTNLNEAKMTIIEIVRFIRNAINDKDDDKNT